MKREDAIERIKKLMAITHESGATDSEVFTAITMADKLRIKYKIDKNEIQSNTSDITREEFEVKYGYYAYPIRTLGAHFRCEILLGGRLNGKDAWVVAYGFKEDIELFIPVAEALIEYLNQTLFGQSTQYSSQKSKYSYLMGFYRGLRQALKNSIKELNLEKKYEVAVVGVPEVIRELSSKRTTRVAFSKMNVMDDSAYAKGYDEGLKYQIGKDKNNETKCLY